MGRDKETKTEDGTQGRKAHGTWQSNRKKKKFKYLDLNELKKRTDKEDKIEKLIESFQKNWVTNTISPKGGKATQKEETFLMRKNLSCFTKKLKQFRRELN